MDGGTRVAEVLKAHGVRFVSTLVGGHISPVLVACNQAGIRVVDVRHEATAVFTADAASRLTGVPGVAVVSAGPGVTNTITAIKNAQMAQSSLVLIGGATATMLRGRGSSQDIDQMALMSPHVKWASRPNTLREIVPTLEKAFEEARGGVPGPVFVELAMDLLYDEEVVREWYAKKIDKPDKSLLEHALSTYIKGHLAYQFALSEKPIIHPPRPTIISGGSEKDIKRAARMLSESRRPAMIVGSQAMLRPNKVGALVAAIETLDVPVFLTGLARGLLGKGHRLQMRHKRIEALKEADVVLLAGVPNDFRLDYGSHLSRSAVISVNLSEKDLTRNRRPELGVHGDPCTFLCALAELSFEGAADRSTWHEGLRDRDDARHDEIRSMAFETTDFINPLALCEGIERTISDKSILIGDGGDFVAAFNYTVNPRGPYKWLDPGVFGTLGIGAGFALGARLTQPEDDVWLFYGDGAAGFSIMEFDTFVRHKLPIIAVVGNNAGWTQTERDQVAIFGDNVACGLVHMAYHKIAEACGGKGLLLDDPENIDEVLAEAVELSRQGHPVLVNAILGRTDFRRGSISV